MTFNLSFIDVVDDMIASVSDVMILGKLLAAVLLNYYDKEIENYDEVVVVLSDLESHLKTFPKHDLDLKNWESPVVKPSIDELLKLELKILPPHLLYAF